MTTTPTHKTIKIIRASQLARLFDTSPLGLTQKKVVEMYKRSRPPVDFYVVPVKAKGRKHKDNISILFEIFFDVDTSEDIEPLPRSGVVVTHRKTPRRYKFETAFKFLTEEIGLQEIKTLSFKEKIERGM